MAVSTLILYHVTPGYDVAGTGTHNTCKQDAKFGVRLEEQKWPPPVTSISAPALPQPIYPQRWCASVLFLWVGYSHPYMSVNEWKASVNIGCSGEGSQQRRLVGA